MATNQSSESADLLIFQDWREAIEEERQNPDMDPGDVWWLDQLKEGVEQVTNVRCTGCGRQFHKRVNCSALHAVRLAMSHKYGERRGGWKKTAPNW